VFAFVGISSTQGVLNAQLHDIGVFGSFGRHLQSSHRAALRHVVLGRQLVVPGIS
jgi:hypothetical protein